MPASQLTLVMPPQQGLLVGFAAGLISLANFVSSRRLGVAVEILDLSNESEDEMQSRIGAASWPDRTHFVGITTTTASYQAALIVAREFRERDPKCVIILGGHHVSGDPEVVIRNHVGLIDMVVIGEGERALTEILERYPDKESISGIAFIDGYGQYQHNCSPASLTQSELDSLDIIFKDRGLVGEPGKFNHVTYVSARGCPLKCSFCAVSNERIRGKGIPAVVEDIERLLEMGFTRIAIEDNFFAHTPKRTKELCSALAEVKAKWGDSFNWDCQTRVESLAREGTVKLLESAGCDAVYIGVESVLPKNLLQLNKTLNPSRYLDSLTGNVVPTLLASQVDCFINIQFGLPGETVGDNRESAELLRKLGAMAADKEKQITVFPQLHVLYPGTAQFRDGINNKLFPKDVFEAFTKWEADQEPVLLWLGEHFGHGTGGIPVGIMSEGCLATGEFQIAPDAVARTSAALKAIDRIPGIEVFMYGDHIVK